MGGGGGGGRGRSRTQRRHFAQSRENTWKRPRSDPSDANQGEGNSQSGDPTWQPFSTQNPAFDEYYKEQAIVSPEEWDTFIEYLRKPLPAAFRINSSSQFCMDIKSQLENDFMKSLQSEFVGGDEAEAIRPLPWYPDNLAWHSNFSRMQLRKNQALEKFHEFLKLENEIGNITRQEAVSMVPPLFLDVQSDHFVLDMCAAPGSKTFQLLEIIHRSTGPGRLPDGLVLANDLDVQRCNLLIHQTKRMCTANVVVTNHEAQHFPGCRLNKNWVGASEVNGQSEASPNQLLFDRVLCDVPCSGDGTLRKAPDIWRKWNSGMGNGLHGLQIQIALRGLSLLKVGGRMVYSTCSMNPIENEAVVAEILRRREGFVELVDVSMELPQLIRRPGLRKWKVRDKGTWVTSYKDAEKSRRAAVIPSMFPCGRGLTDPADENSERDDLAGQETKPEDDTEQLENDAAPTTDLEEEISNLPLERCMRIVPHDQNGGAFFIAVLRKIAPFPAGMQKPMSKRAKPSSEKDELPKEVPDKASEHVNGLGDKSADALNEKVPEAASDHTDGSEAAVLEIDSSNMHESGDGSARGTGVSGNGGTDQMKAGGKRKLQMQGKWKGVDPVVFFKDEAVINGIKTFYGIVESFPLDGHLVTRNEDTNHVKRIYFISKSVKELLELNFQVGQPLKITSIGLKMFERQSSIQGTSAPCSFRISSEGLPLLLPYITKQILRASLVDFKHLLQYKSIKFSDFVDSEFRDKASDLQPGCCVIVLKSEEMPLSGLDTADRIAIGCWKGKASLSVLVTAIDCQELMERLVARMETGKDSSLQETETTSDNAIDEEINKVEKPEDAKTIEPAIEG
ncbi:RNA cytosine-C(5)-methyltransferase NSUN2-like isoform X2 [Punica granatum]|uniref:RNA cytosine-C(5)-methyltransferase NSUN2-like isoform X2 n=1 Tax=Punica granatum TaxID=22663 RepID=A0A218VZ07_PUNGR|nr:RNA cytosine-C(5)-methyltransferase NSUN2-like isoform X2 [Punica granatum]OWM65646.1 hypothetical protein CDL15_Pgr017143 [Punica granatum]